MPVAYRFSVKMDRVGPKCRCNTHSPHHWKCWLMAKSPLADFHAENLGMSTSTLWLLLPPKYLSDEQTSYALVCPRVTKLNNLKIETKVDFNHQEKKSLKYIFGNNFYESRNQYLNVMRMYVGSNIYTQNYNCL